MQTASLPFAMVYASVSSRFALAERMGAVDLDETDPSFPAEIAARLQARFESKDGFRELGQQVLDTLEDARQDETFRTACAELLLQAAVLTWSTFEVLVSDVFVLLLNQNPKFATELMRDDRTKRWFQPKELMTMLPDYSYDLSRRMGEVLIGWHPLDDIRAIRSILEVLFPAHSDLQKHLQDHALWLLNQRRNLIVHRRAIVDRAYLENTGDSAPFGTRLVVEPDYLKSAVETVRDVGTKILKIAIQQ